jgi:PTH1 family peptidyl-tRNA hydrolase
VVGLGNPGSEFVGTRHNVGEEVAALLAKRHGNETLRPLKGQRASTAEVRFGDPRVALAVPTTYMNDSGVAVRSLIRRFGIEDLGSLIVVHDELDLAPGRLRVKVGGGTAGHNGLRSLEAHLGSTDFLRVRIGVGKPPNAQAGANYVLRRPPKAERELLEVAVVNAADAVEVIVAEGAETAMNRYNGDG